MKATLRIILITAVLGLSALAQQSYTNSVDRTHAIKAASHLTVGMREEIAERILATNGLSAPLRMGCSHGWTCFYALADHSSLGIEIKPKQARADGAWADGLVQAAIIQKNGSNIISITLTNRP
jgi:hypothetical protein